MSNPINSSPTGVGALIPAQPAGTSATAPFVDLAAGSTPTDPKKLSPQYQAVLDAQTAQMQQSALMNAKMGEIADIGLYLSTLESAKRQQFAMVMQNLLSALDAVNKMAKRGYDNAKGYIS
jgi:hypothetical protein